VIGTKMPRAFLLQELLELLLRRRLLATQRMLDGRDEIIWLVFSGWTRIVPLVFCRLDASDCYLGAAGIAPASSPPVRTSRASYHKGRQ
jgi:hypothetical protein